MSGKMICFVSPSAGGKDTILNKLVDIGILKPIVSTTSRDIRQGETNGVEYNFVSDSKAKEMLNNGEFIENRIYKVTNGSEWIYGVTKNSFDITENFNYGVILDYQGLIQMHKYLTSIGYEKSLTSIYIDVPLQERLRRSLYREGNLTDLQCLEICRRAIDDNEKVLPAKYYCDYIVNNEINLKETIYKVIDIIQKRSEDK